MITSLLCSTLARAVLTLQDDSYCRDSNAVLVDQYNRATYVFE